ncbi:hypothetical protein OAL35_01260 [bacterium]|nr:hypothetical protein [bacterium]
MSHHQGSWQAPISPKNLAKSAQRDSPKPEPPNMWGKTLVPTPKLPHRNCVPLAWLGPSYRGNTTADCFTLQTLLPTQNGHLSHAFEPDAMTSIWTHQQRNGAIMAALNHAAVTPDEPNPRVPFLALKTNFTVHEIHCLENLDRLTRFFDGKKFARGNRPV